MTHHKNSKIGTGHWIAVAAAVIMGALIMTISAADAYAVDRATTRAAFSRLTNQYPDIRTYETDGRITRLYGTSFGFGYSPEDAADAFRSQYAEALGVESFDLVPESFLIDNRHTQQVMYDSETGEYKFTLVYFSQQIDGIPVFRSDLRLLVRNVSNYPIVLASSALRNLGEFTVADKSSADAGPALATVSMRHPALTEFTEPSTVIWAGYDDIESDPRLAVTFEGEDGESERWLFVSDATTGEILYEEDQIIFEDVTGNVSGMATENWAADFCEDEVPFPLRYARVAIGSTVAHSDTNGDFVIPNAGTDMVAVQSEIRGLYFRVYNAAGSEELLVDNVIPPGPADFMHNALNMSEYVRAQVNAYVQANITRDLVLKHNPAYPTIASQTSFPIYVNRSDGYCPGNAWYDGSSINFCASGAGYPNTAWQSIVHHEYGHHVVEMAGSGQGQYGEGMSDVMGMLWSDDSDLGLGFFGICSEPLRNADNSHQYPCSGAIHDCGQLISGCVWDTRNELVITEPDDYLDILGNLAVNAVLLHSGTLITPQITIDWLTLDDDDANLGNGSPHWDEICVGFGVHNMDCPELLAITFTYPEGKPDIIAPNQGTSFSVVIGSGAESPVPGSAELYYSIDGAPFHLGTMNVVVGDEYEAILPPVNCGSGIEWYVTAEGQSSGTLTDPSDAPTSAYSVIVATNQVLTFDDNFELNLGWTVTNSVSDGQWGRGVPIGGGDRGDPASDYDGSGQCYLTDNVDDNSDVDDGSTILISPKFRLNGTDALISYARWYSNSQGDSPYADTFTVSVSSDGGSSWVRVETVGPVDESNGGWYTHQFVVSDFVTPSDDVKIRFIASDLGAGSIVEAAVDAVKVIELECESFICGDADGSGMIDIDDAVFLIQYIFASGPAPVPEEAGDVDCSGEIDIDDAVYLIQYIFASGPEPCASCP